MVEDCRVEIWTESDFMQCEDAWQVLLENSTADRLFCSWPWLSEWWRTLSADFDATLRIYAIYNGEQLLGVAPFTLRRYSHKALFVGNRLELLGQFWREPHSVMSEYLDIVIDKRYTDLAVRALAHTLQRDSDWDEVVASNVREDSTIAAMLKQLACNIRCHVRNTDHMVGYVADLTDGFGAFKRGLKSDVRRKAIAHRKRLPDPAVHLATPESYAKMFAIMDDFHASRWGSVHMTGARRKFHASFAAAMVARGQLAMSVLVAEDKPLSVLYNVRVGAQEYNIQSAFSPNHARGISPGYLHLGYCAEDAAAAGVRKLHLLAGTGRKRDYKRDFCGVQHELATVQLIRKSVLRSMYSLNDRIHALLRPQSATIVR